MAKRKPGEQEYKSSNKGRKGKWNAKQKQLVDASVAIWHTFACIANRDLDGGDPKLASWKKEETERLLKLPDFQQAKLPEAVSTLVNSSTYTHLYTVYSGSGTYYLDETVHQPS